MTLFWRVLFFALIRFPRLYLALFGVFSSQCIFVFWEISLQALFAGYGKEVCIHGATARPNCCTFSSPCFCKTWCQVDFGILHRYSGLITDGGNNGAIIFNTDNLYIVTDFIVV